MTAPQQLRWFHAASRPRAGRERRRGPLSRPLPLLGSKRRSGPRDSLARFPFPPGCVHGGSVILSLVSRGSVPLSCLISPTQKSHFRVCFSTDFSKSRLNFCFASNRRWMADPLGSLIITGLGRTSAQTPSTRPPSGAVRGSSWLSECVHPTHSLSGFYFCSQSTK